MAGRTVPSQEAMRSALALACRAPSVHNSQPWLWKLAEHSAHLYLDSTRLLPALDPTGREMVISCGAVLHHARIAFAAEGWQTTVNQLPNPAQPDHLASLEFSSLEDVDSQAIALAAAAQKRRCDRRPFLPDPVAAELLTALRELAHAEGCDLTFALDTRSRRELELAIEHAGSVQRQRPDYRQELAVWAGRHASAEGVPARSIPAEHPRGMPARDFALVGEGELPVPVLDDGAVLGAFATSGDGYESWLAVGQALSVVLLSATEMGLATCPLSQISEVAAAQNQVREQVCGGVRIPQMALRVGWPATAEFPGPLTPRRTLSDTVGSLF